MSSEKVYKIRIKSNEILLDAFKDRNSTGDVTLCCKDGKVRVHRMVLVSHSKYMADLLRAVPFGSAATVLLTYFCEEVNLLMDLLYKGEVNVQFKSMNRLSELMSELKIESSGCTSD